MELSKISNQELLGRMDKLVRTERKITHVILCHINEVDARRLYADLGFESMFKYLTEHCGYGEDSAYRRLQAAKVLRKAPEIAEKLEDGSLNLTQLTQVQKCIKQESKAGNSIDSVQTLQILEQIQNKSSYETKKVLAVEFNQPIQMHEVLTPQRDDSIRLGLTLTPDQMKDLSEAKDLLSHILPDGNWAEVISYLAKVHIQKIKGKERKEPSPHVEASSIVTMEKSSSTHGFLVTRKRQHIKITDRRKLLHKANHCCEYVDLKSNKKCQSSYQLQIDHKIPLARGGSHSFDNLRVLCRTHNLLSARQWGL
ncbi:HNH endonuclease [Bdellovibrio sp. HCB2-146]|uniref:HNH endonuclease n=1 Tax=Bdellovibrio sp. HCB2-146 TaxID=3394362 RepID=UPI0039BC4EAC